MLLLPTMAYSQKIISDRKEIKELKEEVDKYTKVVIEVAGFSMNVLVGVDSGGLWHFYDTEEDKNKKFKTDIEVFNFMYKNGWNYKEETQSASPSVKTYIFEKK